MRTAAEQFAEFATTLGYDAIPSDVVEHAKDHLLDTYGCGLAASAMEVATEGRSTMRELGGIGDAVVIGQEEGMPGANAAFANAMLCHGLDFDDTHSDSVSHVSTVVCPAALAIAQSKGASGKDLMTAIVIGNEIVTRVGMATPGAFHKRGFHPTAICGIFGATAAVGRLLGNDAETITRAFGIAGSMASGLFAYLADGTPTKPIHPAWAAHGADDRQPAGGVRRDRPEVGLRGQVRRLPRVPRASRRSTSTSSCPTLASAGRLRASPTSRTPHATSSTARLGATASLAAGRTFTADEIDAITVRVPEAGVALVLEPETEKRAPRSEYEGKFSLQYSTAAMLGRGSVGIADYTDEAIGDQSVLDIAAKVSYETKEYASYPSEGFPGGVEIKLANGEVLAAELDHQKGGPDNPMSREEVSAKYRLNAGLALDDAELEAFEANVIGVEEHEDLTVAFKRFLRRQHQHRLAHDRRRVSPRIRKRSSQRGPRLRREGRDPRRFRPGTRRRVPDRDGRDHARNGPLRDHDSRGVRRTRARPRHLRDDHHGALARLDHAAGDPQRQLHRVVDDPLARHGRTAEHVPAEARLRARCARLSR